jgi:hypothetical protein
VPLRAQRGEVSGTSEGPRRGGLGLSVRGLVSGAAKAKAAVPARRRAGAGVHEVPAPVGLPSGSYTSRVAAPSLGGPGFGVVLHDFRAY